MPRREWTTQEWLDWGWFPLELLSLTDWDGRPYPAQQRRRILKLRRYFVVQQRGAYAVLHTSWGVVSVEKRGRQRTYSLNRTYVANRLRELADKIEANEVT